MLYDPLSEIFPLKYRIVAGLLIFSLLAIADWKKNGHESKRLREYAFIVSVVFLTASYAMIHDLITSSISPDYFIAGKGLAADHLKLRAMCLALKASIGPGALIAVGYIFANNPSKRFRQLNYRELVAYLKFPLACAVGAAVLGGILGSFDITGRTPELIGAVANPRAFLIVWGIHWGTYVGGLIGLVLGMILIVRSRRRRLGLPI